MSTNLPIGIRSKAETTALMTVRGFPEMEKLWRMFCKDNREPVSLCDSEIVNARDGHMAPLFGFPRLVSAVLAGISLVLCSKFSLTPSYSQGYDSAFSRSFLLLATSMGIFFLLVYSATVLQRYVVFPLERLMAEDLAFMLRWKNYHEWFQASIGATKVLLMLRQKGIGENWDNPNYHVRYAGLDGGYQRVEGVSGCSFVYGVLQQFLGQKDASRRKFVPGRLTPALSQGKLSVSAFVRAHQKDIDACKAGTLSPDSILQLLRSLEAFVQKNSAGDRALQESIRAVETGNFLIGNEVQVEVWRRDPWVDLTHQEEFFSSASLRGVKLMGRGSKGRLGPFGYLRCKAISALDFRTKRGRAVRARLGAACALQGNSLGETLLFVDGVEGSNALRPAVIKQGIEDYARACGFNWVVYNRYAHNQIPKRFAQFVARTGAPLRFVKVAYIEAFKREYLDAFGFPLEPFEYRVPRGGVIGYVVDLRSKESISLGTAPTRWQRLRQWLRMCTLWLLVSYASLLALHSIASTVPMILVPFALLVATLLAVHLWYQRRALRVATKPV